jgi:superfamily II DNA/RNA helicase
MSTLAALRSSKPGARIIVFCTTKRMCDQLCGQMAREFRAAAIHGDKRQQERDYALQGFKDGRCPILVATDVAARGLDVPNVAAVVGGAGGHLSLSRLTGAGTCACRRPPTPGCRTSGGVVARGRR